MPKRLDIKKILVIGSGPIVIGQAAEFDYAGTQACLSLKEEGYEVVLVNSNPATIMTDNLIADKVYMEPLSLEFVSRIIRKERPDAILATLGGQTGLNLCVELKEKGVLDECRAEVLGTDFNSISKAEDRKLFKELCISINEPVLESYISNNCDDALKYANIIGYPIIIRPAYTLGGTGGGFANNDDELLKLVDYGLKLSPVNEVLIEKSIKGYKEIEYEVMRDNNDTCITICNMENIDPIGIHTGDSMVVCPSQTLTNKEYQMLRNSSFKLIRALNIKGGCNVQFALDPLSFDYYVIEVNPRVSRSSALASKASGYPIARVSAKIAVGLNLDEINIANTVAAFEPSLDYIVCKIARFPFDKFYYVDRRLTTQMKATGEVMAIGRNFEESFLKAIRSLEIGIIHPYLKKFKDMDNDSLVKKLKEETDERVIILFELIRKGFNLNILNDITKIDLFFLNGFKKIIEMENYLKDNKLNKDIIYQAKKMGFSDLYLCDLYNMSFKDFYQYRIKNNIKPVYKMIDTCAKEFSSYVPYFYSSYEEENESFVSSNKKVIVIGSGPIRIGQGVEFDYSTVHAIWTLKELGYEAIVINNNPETVSTDYLISDKLYFEPLTIEDVLNIINLENPLGVMVQFGGQTAINLTNKLEEFNINIIGSSCKSIDVSENRDLFENLIDKLNILKPKGKTVFNVEDGIKVANDIKYPVLVRPSYVLGGRAMKIVYSDLELIKYLKNAFEIDYKQPVLIDKYIEGIEVEVDAVCDLDDVFIPGIMQHIEKTGVHSGDSISVYPSFSLNKEIKNKIIDYTNKLGKGIKIIGLFNVQYIVDKNNEVYVIEVNPRSSRTVPFISKATKNNIANIATKVCMGYKLKELGYSSKYHEDNKMYYVKAPTFSFSKIKGSDIVLSPEMKSTGEAIGYDISLNRAFYKALKASGMKVQNYGTVFVTLSDRTKEDALKYIKRFYDLGFNIEATKGTALYLKSHNIKTRILKKISENSDEILEAIRKGYISYIVNTVTNNDTSSSDDGYIIRSVAAENNLTTFTSLDTLGVLLDVLEEITMGVDVI